MRLWRKNVDKPTDRTHDVLVRSGYKQIKSKVEYFGINAPEKSNSDIIKLIKEKLGFDAE